jgi:trehalose 6-phosphate synthase/phosphatase
MSRTIIVSNRLPIKVSQEGDHFSFRTSEGGLATGLGSVYKPNENIWIGWPGIIPENKQDKEQIAAALKEESLYPVFLSQDEVNNFYEGFCNEILWPVFHYMPTYARFDQSFWKAYVEVNRRFAAAVIENVEENDTVWVHDYQLLLVPAFLRELKPNLSIGFFNHIPFPSYEIFRLIPWRKELIHGILGADLIGFHTYDDVRHFLSTVTHLSGLRNSANVIRTEDRAVVVESFPMGIEDKKFREAVHNEQVQENISSLQKMFSDTKMILSIDRLDYSKGILQRLNAFELFLTEQPEFKEKVSLYMIVVPSRDNVPQYKELRDEIDKIVGNINSRFRTITWVPIHYFYQSAPFEMLAALYHFAHICLVTPMRDGMNLVCKEYVASRVNNDGMLILSEMAGAAKELVEAWIVNPNNVHEISEAIYVALKMPLEEQERRMKQLRYVVEKFNISSWVRNFMNRLNEVKQMQESMQAKRLNAYKENAIREDYANNSKRVLFLDYDGTLVDFQTNIYHAKPDKELYQLLAALASDPYNKLVLISGRNYQTLEEWLGDLKMDMIAEHGAWTKFHGDEWKSIPGLTDDWKKEVLQVLNTYTDRTPGSFIEEKAFSLVWHYRRTDEGLGELRANELTNNLKYLVSDRGLQILQGNKVIEVKNAEINKGKAVAAWISENHPDMMIAIGDDHTDEDIFKSLPDEAVTIKVGSNISVAKYFLNNYVEVRRFLSMLSTTGSKGERNERTPSATTRPFIS